MKCFMQFTKPIAILKKQIDLNYTYETNRWVRSFLNSKLACFNVSGILGKPAWLVGRFPSVWGRHLTNKKLIINR